MKKTDGKAQAQLLTRLLTDVELEIMTILWRISEGSVADVIEELPKHRDLAYTSVSTMLRILEQKRVVKTRKEGRGHIYVPLVSKSDYESTAVRDVVERVFEGAPSALVRQLINSVELSTEELRELKELISRAEAKR